MRIAKKSRKFADGLHNANVLSKGPHTYGGGGRSYNKKMAYTTVYAIFLTKYMYFFMFIRLEVKLRHDLYAVVGDPMEVFVRQTGLSIDTFLGIAVVHGRDVILDTHLELTDGVEQGRRKAPHLVHILPAREIEHVSFAIVIRIP